MEKNGKWKGKKGEVEKTKNEKNKRKSERKMKEKGKRKRLIKIERATERKRENRAWFFPQHARLLFDVNYTLYVRYYKVR